MMRQGNSLHVMGSKVAPDVQMDVNATNALQHLKQELANCQSDNKRLSEQLNCLITLIKRSWTGDQNATVHLSNIVGLQHPPALKKNDGFIARPNSQAQIKTKSECNWERFAIKLLDRDYQAVQSEIREYQRRYLENRQMYMDAILQDHQHNMSRVNLHRRSETPSGMDDIDNKFIKHNKMDRTDIDYLYYYMLALQRMGVQGFKKPRAQSAVTHRKTGAGDAVEQMDVSFRELVGDAPSSEHFVNAQPQSAHRSVAPSAPALRRPMSSVIPGRQRPTYDDSARYIQKNLFGLNESDPVRKLRPVSASSLRDGDNIRSRPRSGVTSQPVFVTQKNERPLKYETTRPVKPKSATQRSNSIGSHGKKVKFDKKSLLMSQTDVISSSNGMLSDPDGEGTFVLGHPQTHDHSLDRVGDHLPNSDECEGFESDSIDYENVNTKPPLAVRVKSTHIRRPGFIDEFADDEIAMKDMENDFKKTALSLQKRLGIDNSGVVFYG